MYVIVSAVPCCHGLPPHTFPEMEKLHSKMSQGFPDLAGGLFWNLVFYSSDSESCSVAISSPANTVF